MITLFYLAGLLVLLAISASFSAAETAIVGISHSKVHRLVKENRWGATSLQRIKKNMRRTLTAILIGNNIFNTLISSLSTLLTIEVLGSAWLGASIGLIFFFILMFGEIFPKTASTVYTERVARYLAPGIELLAFILSPMIHVVQFVPGKVLGLKEYGKKIVSEKEINEIMELGLEEKVLEKGEFGMMKRVLQFNEIPVKDIITPIDRVVKIGADDPVEDVIRQVSSHDYTRYPVTNRYGRIIGSLKTKSLFRHAYDGRKTKISQLVEEPLFMDEETKIDDAFSMMKLRHRHIAYAVNESGKVTGIITTEDVIEELVGEY